MTPSSMRLFPDFLRFATLSKPAWMILTISCLMLVVPSDAFVFRTSTNNHGSLFRDASLRPQPWFPSQSVSTQRMPHRMVKYEELMEKMPSTAVVDAVEATSSGKVIAADVAAAAGVSLSQARKDLTALASLSRGDIAVDTDGELIYIFPQNLRSVLSNNSLKYNALATFRKAWPGLFWFIRVSFGVTLLVSLAAIFSTILFIQSSSSSDDRDDDRRDRRGGMSFGGSYMWGPSPFGIFYWNRPYGYYYAEPSQRTDPEEMGFLPSIFSYVFGDGNPNAQVEEKRLSLAAATIRENKGAVTAEQLAPFCDDAPTPSKFGEATYVDEVSTMHSCSGDYYVVAGVSPALPLLCFGAT